MKFSQRIGLLPATKAFQKETMDDELKNTLWSLLTLIYWEGFLGPEDSYYNRTSDVRGSNLDTLIVAIWFHYFKKPIDTIDRYWQNCLVRLRDGFFELRWNEVYDFVEFVANRGPEEVKSEFISLCNKAFASENSAYRFVDGRIVEITSDEEIASIEDAIQAATPYAGVKEHLSRALILMSDRGNPDFRNSIKESISSVESLAKQIGGNEAGQFRSVLNALERNTGLHPALKSAFTSLYGYTSDANGIRHALLSEESLTKSDARFMLVCCSAFVNFVIEDVAA